nr:hypothetical protein [Tanacetum cinerariifolium]
MFACYKTNYSVAGSGGKRTGPLVVEATTDGFELWRAKKSGSGGGEVNGHREFRKEAIAGACVVFQLTDIVESVNVDAGGAPDVVAPAA